VLGELAAMGAGDAVLGNVGRGSVLGSALEARLCYLVCHPPSGGDAPVGLGGNVLHLQECFALVAEFAAQGLITSRARELVTSRLVLWAEKAALPEIHQRSACLVQVAEAAPSVVDALVERLQRCDLERAGRGQLRGHAELLRDLQNCGILAEGGELEKKLAHQLKACVEAWKLPRLEQELQQEAGLLSLCSDWVALIGGVREALSAKLSRATVEALGSLQRPRDLALAMQELALCRRLVERADCLGLTDFTRPQSTAVVRALTDCYARCAVIRGFADDLESIKRLEWQFIRCFNTRSHGDDN